MITVYKRYNKITCKMYIGVTCRTLEERWQRVVDAANHLENDIRTSHRKRSFHKVKSHMRRGTMIYDVATMGSGTDIWRHCALEVHKNMIAALLAERRFIVSYNTLTPYGYNMTSGGEIPEYTNVAEVIRWYNEYLEMYAPNERDPEFSRYSP